MRTKDENKRIAIRDATIKEVVVGGLSGASIAKIANRAGLSQGTIYLYYPTKEELLRQVYFEIKQGLRDVLMNLYDPAAPSADNIKTLWFALLDYAITHPNNFTYTEYIAGANLVDTSQEPELQKIEKELKSIIQTAIDDGTLISAPYESLQAVLVAPVTLLSRKITINKQRVTKKARESTFALIWQGIAKR